MNYWNFIAATTCLAISGCAIELATGTRQFAESTVKAGANLSVGEDSYNRALGVSITDLQPTYIAGSKIAATVRIKNHGPPKTDPPPKHPQVQLFPHLTLWIKQNSNLTTERIRLPIENRIRIKQGETFERTIDLSEMDVLTTPGEYHVAIGHENWVTTDLGDWTGTLRTPVSYTHLTLPTICSV